MLVLVHKHEMSLSQVSIPALQDPLLQGIQRKFIEAGVIKQCETGMLNHQDPLEVFHTAGGGHLACDSRCLPEALVTSPPGRPCSTREVNELSKAELPLLPLSRQHMDSIAWLKIPYLYIASEVYKTNR